jgi:hypothetical protein
VAEEVVHACLEQCEGRVKVSYRDEPPVLKA